MQKILSTEEQNNYMTKSLGNIYIFLNIFNMLSM